MLAKAEISHSHMSSGWNLLALLLLKQSFFLLKLMLKIWVFELMLNILVCGCGGIFLQMAKLRALRDFWLGFICSVLKISRAVELIKSFKTRNDKCPF